MQLIRMKAKLRKSPRCFDGAEHIHNSAGLLRDGCAGTIHLLRRQGERNRTMAERSRVCQIASTLYKWLGNRDIPKASLGNPRLALQIGPKTNDYLEVDI
mmetsp:Transcript_35321/g.140393  ORF Transcript_35321/g.140393 Transcript_35321/m.140393 type:complete len:100 (-) Transcript_35321:112-411(-)